VALGDTPHVAVKRDEDGIVDIGDRADELVGGAPSKRPIQEVNLVAGLEESMPNGIRYSLIEEQPERWPVTHYAAA
jgi:hypothetical protein